LPPPVPVETPPPDRACPTDIFSRIEESAGTSEVTIVFEAASESDGGEIADELDGVTEAVVGDGRAARVGEERRSDDRVDWVIIDV
jgi:hypothetical protein